MVKVVFDTVVFLRALINSRGRWGQLLFDRESCYRLVVSQPVTHDVAEVIGRPAVMALFRPLPGRAPSSILATLATAEAVEIDEAAFPPVSRDREDDKILATAKTDAAAYVVSEDDDLFVLGEYDGIRIVDAATFLRILDHLPPEADAEGGA